MVLRWSGQVWKGAFLWDMVEWMEAKAPNRGEGSKVISQFFSLN